MDSVKEKDGTQVRNNNFGTFKAFTFIKQSQQLGLEALCKYGQVSTHVSWKIPLQQNYKRQKEKYSLNEVFD